MMKMILNTKELETYEIYLMKLMKLMKTITNQ